MALAVRTWTGRPHFHVLTDAATQRSDENDRAAWIVDRVRGSALHNPHIDRLRARGKPYKCAIVAVMRKLLIHLQSLLKNPENALA